MRPEDAFICVVSVPDRLVRDPQTRRIVDEAGITVSAFDPVWTRLIGDGDVAIAPAEPAPAEAAKEIEE